MVSKISTDYKSFKLAVLTYLTGIFFLNMMSVMIKFIGDSYSPIQISLYRNIFGLIPILLIFLFSTKLNEYKHSLIIPKYWIAVLRGGCIALAQICFFTALVHIEFATATALSFATPLVITILSIPILKQVVGIWRWSAVILGFSGVFMIINPTSDIFSFYSILPLGAALGYGLSMVLVRLFPSDVPSNIIQGHSQVSSIFFSVLFLVISFKYIEIQNFKDFIFLMLMGTFGGLGVFLLIAAFRMTKPLNVAPFEYFGILFAFTLGWVIFGEAPFQDLFPGIFAIIGAGLLIFWREKRKVKKKNFADS